MLQTVCQKFSGGCMMVFRRADDEVQFLGTAFLVHENGYLLTVSHILPDEGQLMVVAGGAGNTFTPITQETVTSIPVKVARRNLKQDVALLKMEAGMGMRLPDHFLGSAESIMVGNSVMAMGFSFGHQTLHALIDMSAIISAKVLSHNQSKLLLFDNMVHDGDRGGPLISVTEGLVVGIINGRFDPQEASKSYIDSSRTLAANTNISFAVAIDYGIALMEEEGLQPH
ncbi:MAG: serine protease [Desulfuromonadales bacterium]|nr:serine protease [Desulfuromonadales bacterium]